MSYKYLTASNYNEEVEKSSTPVIIDFYADWCMPCKMMAPVFEDLSDEYTGKLKFLKLNTEEEYELSAKFKVQGIPSLIILKDGKEIDRIVGFGPKEAIKSKIDDVLRKI